MQIQIKGKLIFPSRFGANAGRYQTTATTFYLGGLNMNEI